jgi:tyrosine-protein kinase Etk/Wzc
VQLWATLRQHYRFVLGVALAAFALVMTVTLTSGMTFRAVGRLYLGELEDSGARAAARTNEIDISAGNQGALGSEVEIIRSRSLVARAILDAGLNATIIARGHPSPRYGSWLLSRRDPALLDVAAQEVRATDSLLTEKYGKERAYSVRFVGDTEYEVWGTERRLARGRLDEAVQLPGARLTLVAGSERGPKRGAEYTVTVSPLQEVTDATLDALQVSAPKPQPPAQPVNVVTLEFRGQSPRLAARFLERLLAAYLNERQSWKAEDATAAEAFVTNQLKKTRETLDDLQKKLADYRSNNRVVVMENEAKAMIEQIGKYEEQRVAARLEVAALSELKRAISAPNPPVGAFLLGEANDPVIERMASSLSDARQTLTDLESRFNPAAPDVQAQQGQVAAQLESIKNYVSSRAARARENLNTLDSIIKQFEQRLNTVPGAELGLVRLSRESDVYDRTYSYLLERQQQTAIIKASTLSKNRVLDAPEVAYREDSPKLLLRLASGPLGLFLGILAVLLRSFFAKTFQSETDLRGSVNGLPIFASVPRRPKQRRHPPRGAQPAESLDVFSGDPNSSFAEAFRLLRTNLYRSGSNGLGRVLLMTSPNPGDGKTTCALGLAAVLAADRKRVLVVDADLRQPNPGVTLHADEGPGLGDVLNGKCSWVEALRTVRVPMGGFFMLSGGCVAPAELLSSPRMAQFLSNAREQFDFVLLDVPSFPRASDAVVLSLTVDCVLSVFRLQNSSRKLAAEHLRGLASEARNHAILINDVGVSCSGAKLQRRAKPWRKSAAPPAVVAALAQAAGQRGAEREITTSE